MTKIYIDDQEYEVDCRKTAARRPLAGAEPALFLLASGAGIGRCLPPVRS